MAIAIGFLLCDQLLTIVEGGEQTMTIYERLDDDTKWKVRELNHQLKFDNKLTKSELEMLMGVRRDTYRKVNGRVKRK